MKKGVCGSVIRLILFAGTVPRAPDPPRRSPRRTGLSRYMIPSESNAHRIVITGVGLTAPNGNTLGEFRRNLLSGVSGVQDYETRYFGKTLAGVCDYDALKYQRRKELRRGTRAGSIGIYCSQEAVADAKIDLDAVDKSRVGAFIGVTEHGNVETENEVYHLKGYDYDTNYWSHHHNPRTVANNPSGEVSLNMGITGPCYTLGAACAAGNAGIIHGTQMLRLGECDLALVGGRVREYPHPSASSLVSTARTPSPSTTTRPKDRARSIRIATGSSSPKGDVSLLWSDWKTRPRAARRYTVKS